MDGTQHDRNAHHPQVGDRDRLAPGHGWTTGRPPCASPFRPGSPTGDGRRRPGTNHA